jgi:hypothetical protein
MNRRDFFKKAATGAAVLAATPAVLSEPFMSKIRPVDVHPYEPPNWVSYRFRMTLTAPPPSRSRITHIEA